jgi:surfeit locus 1 family protein
VTDSAATARPALDRRFWWYTLAAGLGIALTVALGCWQLSRAARKEAMHAAMEEKKSLPALEITGFSAIENEASKLYRRVVLRGRWLPGHTVFIDNRQMRGTPGFFVMTPFLPEQGGPAVLVQRGWVQRDFLDRTRLPRVDTPGGPVRMEGRIVPPPSKLFEIGGRDTAQGASPIRQNLDLAAFGAEIGVPLVQQVSVQQTGASSEGLLRDWPEVNLGVEKHYGYAFQWFGFAGLTAALYVWFQIVRRFHAPRR